MTTETLLPPNSTAQERALEVAMRPDADLVAGVDLIRTAKENPPDDWLYWLIWEYGLQELLPYIPDLRQVIDQGLIWQRIRGTPASVTQALGWIPLADAEVVEEDPRTAHWYEFLVDAGKIPTRAELEALVGLARLSAPVGTRLSLVYHGYYYPRAVYDYTSWSDGSLYSDHSGVYDQDLDVDLSFGRTLQSIAELGTPAVTSILSRNFTPKAAYEDRLLYSFASYDDPPLLNYNFQRDMLAQIVGPVGVGRNILALDGSWILDGSEDLGGAPVAERPQYPAKHTTGMAGGGTWTGGWTNRTWTGE